MEWFDCKDVLPPKEGKFLFTYYYGIGLGEWGQCYTTFNGNSERTHEAYILILHPSEFEDNESQRPYTWSEQYMIEMEVSWGYLPEMPYRPKEAKPFWKSKV